MSWVTENWLKENLHEILIRTSGNTGQWEVVFFPSEPEKRVSMHFQYFPTADGILEAAAPLVRPGPIPSNVIMKYEQLDLEGDGIGRRRQVFYMPMAHENNYLASVTDVPCPSGCGGLVRWAEKFFIGKHRPGYRVCEKCCRHWLARGEATAPTLVLMEGAEVR